MDFSLPFLFAIIGLFAGYWLALQVLDRKMTMKDIQIKVYKDRIDTLLFKSRQHIDLNNLSKEKVSKFFSAWNKWKAGKK
jgi:hypothetical protein